MIIWLLYTAHAILEILHYTPRLKSRHTHTNPKKKKKHQKHLIRNIHYSMMKLIKNMQNVGDNRQMETVKYCHVKWTSVWKPKVTGAGISQQGHIWSKIIVLCKSMLTENIKRAWGVLVHCCECQTQMVLSICAISLIHSGLKRFWNFPLPTQHLAIQSCKNTHINVSAITIAFKFSSQNSRGLSPRGAMPTLF